MTPTRMRECLAALGLSQRGLASVLNCQERLVRAWAAGKIEIPELVVDWLELSVRVRKADLRPERKASAHKAAIATS